MEDTDETDDESTSPSTNFQVLHPPTFDLENLIADWEENNISHQNLSTDQGHSAAVSES